MSARVVKFDEARARRIRHVLMAETTDRTVDLSRYARRERLARRLDAAVSLCLLAAFFFTTIALLAPLIAEALEAWLR